ncbi:UNVERIFIED_CONTAM: hypothetical protein NY603_32355, partial [Bacteroidetes bacterium 56_B9]
SDVKLRSQVGAPVATVDSIVKLDKRIPCLQVKNLEFTLWSRVHSTLLRAAIPFFDVIILCVSIALSRFGYPVILSS